MKPLRILSWNTFLMPGIVQPTPEHTKRAEMIAAYLKARAANFEILCIEKAFNDARRSTIVDALKGLFPHVIDPLVKTPFAKAIGGFNSGITLLSKLPLQPLVRHDFDAAAGSEASEPKGFVIVEATWEQQPFQLAVCHLQGHIQCESKEKRARYAQIFELKDGLDSVRRNNITQIVCGDFAIKPGTAEYETLRAELGVDDPSANASLWSTSEAMREKFPNIKNKIDGTELSDYVFLRNSTPAELSAIQRGSLKDATGNWKTVLSPGDEFLSYKTPMTASITLQLSAQKPAPSPASDFASGAEQRTYLSFHVGAPERTYNRFVSQPQDPAGLEYGLADLKQIAADAYAKGKICRAVGSGHSFSHVGRVSHASKAGYLVDIGGGVGDVARRAPSGINGFRVLNSQDSRFSQPWITANLPATHRLVELGAGTTIKELNEGLEAQGLGLINMGTYNGQTFAGASSNSTHGSGGALPPFPDLIRSLVLVSLDAAGKPRAYRIEPTQGPTDRTRFTRTQVDELIQDDDLFYSAICAMGSFGLIHSFIIEARPFYLLDESTELVTWSEIANAGIAALKKDVQAVRHFELVVAPYTEKVALDLQRFKDEIAVLKVRRDISQKTKPQGMKRGCLLTLFGGLEDLFSEEATRYVACYGSDYRTDKPGSVGVKGESFPWKLRELVSPSPYTDKYYRVFRQGGHVIGGYAIELTAPIDRTIEVMGKIHQVCQANKDKGYAHSGPIGVRFVKASKAYLSQFHGKDSVTYEVTMLRGTPNGFQALKNVQDAFLNDPEIRMHWGLTLVDGQEKRSLPHWKARFPKFDTWHQAYRRFNAHGVFSSKFTEWMGID